MLRDFFLKKVKNKMKTRGHCAGTQTCKLYLLLECVKVHDNTRASTALLVRQMPFMRSATVEQMALQPHLSVFVTNKMLHIHVHLTLWYILLLGLIRGICSEMTELLKAGYQCTVKRMRQASAN